MSSHFAQLHVSLYMTGIPALERLNNATREIISEPVRDLIENTEIVLMYICYPVLEGLAKFALSPLINEEGLVKVSFTDGKEIFKNGNRLSNIAKILRALEINGTANSNVAEVPDNLGILDYKLKE